MKEPREPRFVYSATQSWQLIQAIKRKASSLGLPGHVVSSEQALEWLEAFPLDLIEPALEVGAAWYVRQQVKPPDSGVCRYIGGVLRKKDEARERMKSLELAMKMEQWEALTDKQRAEFPGGFADFQSFDVVG